MPHVVFAGNIDIALVALWAFFIFFVGLVIYLHRESYREGYPLEDAKTGRTNLGVEPLNMPQPKTFHLPFGRGSVTKPDGKREPLEIAARRADPSPGAPYIPTGNPMVDGVGPAAWANRADVPDLDGEGHPRIVPLAATDLWLEGRDPDPRGLAVYGADGAKAGTVSEVWVDRAERMVRYLAVDTGTRTVLMPMNVALVRRGSVSTDAILAGQFAGVPAIKGTGQITFLEEERVQAYFGGGYLYATPERQESCL